MDEMDLNLKLVHAVKKFTFLYDYTDTYYSNSKEKEAAWKEIAKDLRVSEAKCKDRWRNIRSSYLRHLNNVHSTEAGGKSKTPYYLADHLPFLQPFIKSKKQKENSSASNENSEGDGLCYYLSSLDDTQLTAPDEESDNITETKYAVSSSCSKPVKRERRSESPDMANLRSKVVAEYSRDQDSDPDMDFFRSLLPDFRPLWPAKKRRVKIEIMKLIDQACSEEF